MMIVGMTTETQHRDEGTESGGVDLSPSKPGTRRLNMRQAVLLLVVLIGIGGWIEYRANDSSNWSHEEFLRRMEDSFRAGRYNRVEELAETGRKRFSSHPRDIADFLLMAARAQAEQRAYIAATATCEELINLCEIVPSVRFAAHVCYADVLLRQAKWRELLDLLPVFARHTESSEHAFWLRKIEATACDALGDLGQARNLYTRMLMDFASYPQRTAEVRMQLAWTELRMGEPALFLVLFPGFLDSERSPEEKRGQFIRLFDVLEATAQRSVAAQVVDLYRDFLFRDASREGDTFRLQVAHRLEKIGCRKNAMEIFQRLAEQSGDPTIRRQAEENRNRLGEEENTNPA